MIPTASVLASILNDPEIPAEAKPMSRFGVATVDRNGSIRFDTYGIVTAEAANFHLYWSLSAWLWERGFSVRVSATYAGAVLPNESIGYVGSHCDEQDVSPVERLAVVVKRAVAARGAKA